MNPITTIFGALMSLILPLRWTGRLYLEQQLRENGVNTSKLPKACLQELADDVIAHAREDARTWRKNVRSQVVQFTKGSAILIAQVLKGTASGGTTNERIRSVLRKHGVVHYARQAWRDSGRNPPANHREQDMTRDEAEKAVDVVMSEWQDLTCWGFSTREPRTTLRLAPSCGTTAGRTSSAP
jgi:hypothetical protein